MSETTELSESIAQGGDLASEELLPVVYEQLRRLAGARMAGEQPGHTLQPTALVHEAWLRLAGDGGRSWENRGHFFAAAAEAMRRILIENARRQSRLKRGNGRLQLNIEEVEIASTTPDEKILLINDAVKQLETESPEHARVVVLKFFGGLTNKEVAEALELGERTVNRQWTYAKAWLYRTIRAQM